MTCEFPPDSAAMTHEPNEPPGVPPEYPLAATAVDRTGAYAVLAAAGAGAGMAGPSSPGALGILAGLAGTFRTCPAVMSFAHRIWLWLAQ